MGDLPYISILQIGDERRSDAWHFLFQDSDFQLTNMNMNSW